MAPAIAPCRAIARWRGPAACGPLLGTMIVGPATIVSGGSTPHILPHAALRIVGAHVAAFGPFADVTRAFPDDAVWDTGHRIVLPGLIDAYVRPSGMLAEGLAGFVDADEPVPGW